MEVKGREGTPDGEGRGNLDLEEQLNGLEERLKGCGGSERDCCQQVTASPATGMPCL